MRSYFSLNTHRGAKVTACTTGSARYIIYYCIYQYREHFQPNHLSGDTFTILTSSSSPHCDAADDQKIRYDINPANGKSRSTNVACTCELPWSCVDRNLPLRAPPGALLVDEDLMDGHGHGPR